MSPQGNLPANLEVPPVIELSTATNPRTAYSQKAPNSERAFFQFDLTRSLQLHRRLALSIAAVGLALGMIYYFAMAPVYLAQCLVYIQPAPPSVIQQGYANRWPYDSTTYDSYIQQQIGNAMREDVLSNALKKLGDAGKKPDESDQDALDRLRKQLDVARVGQTYQFTIGARASTPELAAQTANAVAASYIESTAHDQKAGDQQRLTMLREERDRVQSALDADRAEQQELNKQLGVASVGGAPDHFDQDITEIRTELVKARTEHDAAEAKFAAMGANHGTNSNAIDAAADESADMDAGLVSMKTALNARKAFLISKMANLTPGNPEYKQDSAELTQINANLDQMMKDLRDRAASHIQLQLRSELERTAGVEAQLNGQLRQLVSSATNATSKLQRASDLAADITRLQSRYSTVDEQLHNRMLEDAAPTGAYVSTPAEVPIHRAKSGRTRNALVIVMAGFFLGLIAAVIRHKMDRHVYVGSDVESVLGFGPMAMLPDFGEVSESAAEEHLLRLAAAIEHAHKQGHMRSCIFTGADAGTGVTTIVTRVRTLLEAMGRPTVYMDASGTSAEDEPEEPTEGRHGTQALATAGGRSRKSALSYRIANEGDNQTLLLTDAAPIAVSAETEYLARFADCAIVVVESGVTTRAEIRDAAATLQRLNVGTVGFVLNRVGLAKADPAFRASVDAIERHLQSQMGVAARRIKRTDAVVTANGNAPIPELADVSSSASIELSPSQVASALESNRQATSPRELSPQASSPLGTGQEPSTSAEPSWMSNTGKISAVEPSLPKTWTQACPPAGAPAPSAVTTPLESAGAYPS
jgi:succinoglycan biosynthesis transport protein ExoP